MPSDVKTRSLSPSGGKDDHAPENASVKASFSRKQRGMPSLRSTCGHSSLCYIYIRRSFWKTIGVTIGGKDLLF
jgi:hypothetical protein